LVDYLARQPGAPQAPKVGRKIARALPGEVDYAGGISKCRDQRVRTLPHEAADAMLTRQKGQLKLKDRAFVIARGQPPASTTVR